MKKKLLFVTSRIPWPLDKGDKLRAYYQIRDLSEIFDVYLFCINDAGIVAGAENELKKYCREIEIAPLSKIGVLLNLGRTFFTAEPFQVGYFYNSRIIKAFDAFADRIKPDKIFCQLIRTAPLIQSRKEKKILDYMDVFSKGIERRLTKVSITKRPAFKMEYNRLLNYEKSAFDLFDKCTIITEQDRSLIPHSENKSIVVIPNGVDSEFFHPMKREKKYDLLFNGNMNYPPNVEAVIFLCEKIIPVLNNQGVYPTVLISGTNPAPEVLRLASDKIKVSGWVEDIRENFAASKILVAPMQSSIGLQNKLLEGMAMGIPCITTTLANNALKAQDKKDILVANSPEEFAEAIILLLNNSKMAEEMVESASLFIKNNFSWKAVNTRLSEIILNS